MLIKFICQNIYSINDEIEFRMFKSPTRRFDNHVYYSEDRNPDVLKSAIVYGANASGKSNFVNSINIGRRFIFGGPNNPNRIDIPSFKLCADKCSNTMFEYTILSNNKYYVYGYELIRERIIKEWCYKLENRKPVKLFERKSLGNDKFSVVMGNFDKTKKQKDFYSFCKDSTKHTQLFLTTLVNNNSTYFKDIINWFNNLKVIYPNSSLTGSLFSISADKKFYNSFIDILHDLGIDIDSFDFKKGYLDDGWIDFPEDVVKGIKKNISKKNAVHVFSPDGHFYICTLDKDNRIVTTKIIIQHLNDNNEKINFVLSEESDGTRRLFDLIPMLLDIKNNDSVFIVDEIDRSLHSNLSKSLFKLFHKYSKNRPCQLIATTHDTNLMDLNQFRNDEIWYVKKNYLKSTELYSLYEFNQRYDKSLVKDYLSGRFGAVPEININNEL